MCRTTKNTDEAIPSTSAAFKPPKLIRGLSSITLTLTLTLNLTLALTLTLTLIRGLSSITEPHDLVTKALLELPEETRWQKTIGDNIKVTDCSGHGGSKTYKAFHPRKKC